jgi:hypothetical protein
MFGFYSPVTPARTFPYTTFVRDDAGNELPQYTYTSPTTRLVGGNPNHTQTWVELGDSGRWIDTPGSGWVAPWHNLPEYPKQGREAHAPLTDDERARRRADAEYRTRTKPLPPRMRVSNRVSSPNRVVHGTLPPAIPQTGESLTASWGRGNPIGGAHLWDSCYADVSQFDPMIRGVVVRACQKGYDRFFDGIVDANKGKVDVRGTPLPPNMVKKRGKGRTALPGSWWADVYQTVLVWVTEQMANNRRVIESTQTGEEPKFLDPDSSHRMRGWIRKAEQTANQIIPMDPRIVGAVARRSIQTMLDNRNIRIAPTNEGAQAPEREPTVFIPELGDTMRLSEIVGGLFGDRPELGDAVLELFVNRVGIGGGLCELSPDDVARRYGIGRATLFRGMKELTQTLSELADVA